MISAVHDIAAAQPRDPVASIIEIQIDPQACRARLGFAIAIGFGAFGSFVLVVGLIVYGLVVLGVIAAVLLGAALIYVIRWRDTQDKKAQRRSLQVPADVSELAKRFRDEIGNAS